MSVILADGKVVLSIPSSSLEAAVASKAQAARAPIAWPKADAFLQKIDQGIQDEEDKRALETSAPALAISTG